MRSLQDYSLTELKRIYRALHARLPFDEALMDSELMHDLQTWLQRCARDAGVRVTEHAEWDAWLDDRVSDTVRTRGSGPLK